ncbi:LysR family transcriptional regulator [Roseomonas sp. CCTCC AB2023176]|uniref:LysR family transcriptional regulator n=1 Tax=Roseomonas sp. CCTCC AB2023176 TaxID=3342640 RepID=UPI0035D7598D
MLNQIDLSRTDLNLFVLFEAVMEERHVGRAAERLRLTPSAVSHGLGRLRRLLGDPLFLRTPKGVVPTSRAAELAGPVAELLARARGVVGTAERFDPARSARRFTIGAPDGVSAVILPPLLEALRGRAPGIAIGVRQVLPTEGENAVERAWRGALVELEARAMDVAVIPTDAVPPRFARRPLYEEDLVVAVRIGHPFAAEPSLDRYCGLRHLLVSHGGDPAGFIDGLLADQGRSRRVVLTVPNFMLALALVAETDLVAAVPRRLAGLHAARLGIAGVDLPEISARFRLHAVVPRPALMDAGLAWFLDTLTASLP